MTVYLPRNTEAKRQRDNIRKLINQLDDQTIDDFLNRALHADTDAWPPGGQTTGSNDISRPVEAAVTTKAGGRIYRDHTGKEIVTPDTWQTGDDNVRRAIADLFGRLASINTLITTIDQTRQWVLTIHANDGKRTNTIELCYLCDKPITDDKIHRIDGKPYHGTSCYHRENRRRNANAQTHNGAA